MKTQAGFCLGFILKKYELSLLKITYANSVSNRFDATRIRIKPI